jgi:ribosomal protein L32
MGALPKRRISSARRGKRRKDKVLGTKQAKHNPVPNHKVGFIQQIKQLFVSNE